MTNRRFGVTALLLCLVPGSAAAALTDVRINEFLASNQAGLADENGDRSDWIELYNAGPTDEDLGGAYLTDDATTLGKWRLPSVVLPSGGFLVVFASNKNRAVAGAELHTNFKIDKDGEYLGFVAADGTTVISEFAPTFPPQVNDVSYGVGPGGLAGYFETPTPGAPNPSTFFEFVLPVEFSVPHGFYDVPVDVAMSTPTAGAEVRYTSDGSLPTLTNGSVYAGPVHVAGTTALRVVAFRPGFRSTDPVSQTYIFVDDIVVQTGAGFPATWKTRPADYAMDPRIVDDPVYGAEIRDDLKAIPTVSVVADVADLFGANGIYANPQSMGDEWLRPASVELIYPDGSEGFATNSGIRIQGHSSRTPANPKHSFRLAFKPEFGPATLRFPLFPDTPVAENRNLVLHAGSQDGWSRGTGGSLYMRDYYGSNTQLALGQVAAHGIYVHLYVDGLYWGLYMLHELPGDWFSAFYFGGDHDEYDVFKDARLDDGDPTAWRTMHSLASASVGTDPGYAAIRQYLDVDNLIDYLITNHFIGSVQWADANWVAARRRLPGEGFRFFCFDSELSLRKPTQNSTHAGKQSTPTGLYRAMRVYNPEFRMLFADHVQRHFFDDGALTTPVAIARFQALAATLQGPIVAESARWGDARRPSRPFARDREWASELDRVLTTILPIRNTVVLDQYRRLGLYPSVEAPSFNQHGGLVATGFALSMNAPAGVIYYALDGSDPRLAGGAVAPGAMQYTGPVEQTQPAVGLDVKARVLSGTQWSALEEAVFTVQVPQPLRITEMMYHPAPPPGGPFIEDDFEFVELKNVGVSPIDLTGVSFTDGITFAFTGGTLAPGAFVLAVKNPTAFATRYDTTGLTIVGPYAGKLSDSGELIRLADPGNQTLVQFTYADTWYPATDGGGYSLVVVDPTGDLSTLSLPASWTPSVAVGGSPGADG